MEAEARALAILKQYYERLTDEALEELLNDVCAEYERRGMSYVEESWQPTKH